MKLKAKSKLQGQIQELSGNPCVGGGGEGGGAMDNENKAIIQNMHKDVGNGLIPKEDNWCKWDKLWLQDRSEFQYQFWHLLGGVY